MTHSLEHSYDGPTAGGVERETVLGKDWAEIRRLYLAEEMPIKAWWQRLRLSRKAVRSAVRSAKAHDPPPLQVVTCPDSGCRVW
jgi:hypothetical protein